jgi:hypothetical protein
VAGDLAKRPGDSQGIGGVLPEAVGDIKENAQGQPLSDWCVAPATGNDFFDAIFGHTA